MRNPVLALSLILLSFLSAQAQSSITLEDIWTKGTFAAKSVSGFNSMKDGRYYCAEDKNENILRYEFASGKLVDTLVRSSELNWQGKQLTGYSFHWSKDENKLLLQTEMKSIYRHSYTTVVYVYDIKTHTLSSPGITPVMLPQLSPDGSKLAYVKERDLFVYDLQTQKEIRITQTGKKNAISNGAPDWVYEEEFALVQAYCWNPAGDAIAFYEFNEAAVPEYAMPVYGKLYPENETFKYPKAGEANSVIRMFTYQLANGKMIQCDIGKETDIYIPRMTFTPSGSLFIQRLNRLQNKLEFLIADPMNGSTRVIYTEANKAWIDIPEIMFLSKSATFLFNSEQDGWNHVYHYDLKGKMIGQVTKGNWEVDQIYGVNEQNGMLYYSSGEANTTERQVYAISLKGGAKKQLTKVQAWNSATFNSDFSYFLCASSSINTPPVYSLCDGSGAGVRVLEDNQALKDRMSRYMLGSAEMTSFTNAYSEKLNAFIIKPASFDPSKKYPVLMYVYGGPGHQLAVNRWMGGNYFWYQMLADKGYIIVCTDGRGTGAKGEAFKKVTYLQLGKYEIEDQIHVANELKIMPWVNPDRIGIWGWSFGGYMASLGISKGASVFKTAIAVAPVTNWRYYDNIYTERFMRKPQDNGENYDANSPISHVGSIKGNYLIIHGTADDNVHFQNTVEMVNAMINNGVRFDSELYPNKNHGIGGAKTRLHLYERMTRFILEKL